jgi:hypothetical protein
VAGSKARRAGRDIPAAIATAYRTHVDYRREAALRTWAAFILTFAFLRGLTYGIRYHLLPVHNVVLHGGLHIHHFVWGIFLLIIVGFLLLNLDQARWHPWLGIPFGIAAALVIDEFALWLNLEDVYWAAQGRISIDLAIIVGAILGLYYAADCFWKEVTHEVGIVLGFVAREEQRIIRCRHRAA